MYWFTSDQHYDHKNIIKYCNRPFADIDEMNEALIKNHNDLVSPNDIVYHLGDFAFRNHKRYLNRLNGQHHLIVGNHDGNGYKDAGFKTVNRQKSIKIGSQVVYMSHYGHRVWDRSHHGSFHVYGHSHSNLPDLGRSCDVGVDNWDYKPVMFHQLVERFKDVEITF